MCFLRDPRLHDWILTVSVKDGADADPTIDPKVALAEAAPDHLPFYCTSLFYPPDDLLTNASTLSFAQYAYNGTSVDISWYVFLDIFGGKNSAISAVPQDATSYNARGMSSRFPSHR